MTRPAYYIASIILCICIGFDLQAQDPTQTEEDLGNQNVTTVISFKPDIMDSDKRDIEPKVQDSIPEPPKSDYRIIKKRVVTDFQVDTIQPAKLKGAPVPALDRMYVKGGFGTFTSTLLEARYNTLQSRKHSLGVDITHFASQGQVSGRGPGDISNNRAIIYGRKFLKKHVLGAELEVDRDVVHYFGYDPTVVSTTIPELSEDDTRQEFLRYGAGLSVKSFYKDSAKVNHDVKLRYYHLGDQFQVSEDNVVATAYLTRYFSQDLLSMELEADYNILNYANDAVNNNLILKAKPGIQFKGERWRLNAGVGMQIEAGNDEFANEDNTRFHFYPIADFSYRVLGDVIIPYVGITGNLERANLRSLTAENPFLMTNTAVRNQNQKRKLFAGVRGAYSATTSFKLEGSLSRVEDMPLFVNNNLSDPNYPSTIPQELADLQFGILYDTLDIVNVSAEVSYQKTDRWNFLFRGDFFSYTPQFEFEAWHRSQYQFTMSAMYDLRDKIVLRADVFGISSQIAPTNNSGDEIEYGSGLFGRRLNGIVDINIGIEYRYTRRLSAFLNVNNIASTRYRRWNNYRTQGISVLGGLTYSFWAK